MKDKDYLSTLKSALLKSEPTVIKTELFGATVFIRRLTGDYLISYEEKMAETAKLAQRARHRSKSFRSSSMHWFSRMERPFRMSLNPRQPNC